MPSKANKIAAGYFKAHCLQLIDEVSHKHTQIIITKHGKPMAKLVPFQEGQYSLFGCLKDTMTIQADIVSGTEEEWEAEK